MLKDDFEAANLSMKKIKGAESRREGAASKRIDPHLEEMIGAKLRLFYDDLLREPVPDRFMELILKLDAKEREPGDDNGNAE